MKSSHQEEHLRHHCLRQLNRHDADRGGDGVRVPVPRGGVRGNVRQAELDVPVPVHSAVPRGVQGGQDLRLGVLQLHVQQQVQLPVVIPQRRVFKDYFHRHSDLCRHENQFLCRLQP